MHILITGGSGFIGKSFVDHLTLMGDVSKLYLLKNNSELSSSFPEISIVSLQDCEQFNFKIDVVIHLAQSKNYTKFPEEICEVFDTNIALTLKLLELSRKLEVKKFIYFSTSSVYAPSQNIIDEECLISSDTMYSFSKITSENLIKIYSKYFDVVIYRLFFPFGNRMGDKFLNRILNTLKDEGPILISSEKSFLFNPISIKDIVKILHKTLYADLRGTINLAGKEVITFKRFVEVLSDELKVVPQYQISKSALASNNIASINLLNSLLQHEFIPIEESIRNFARLKLL